MADHNDQSPKEKSSSSKQHSPQQDNCPRRTCQDEKSDERQNKTAGGSGGSSSPPSISARKRGLTDVDADADADAAHSESRYGSGSGSKARKKAELEVDVDVPSGEPTCYVCQKVFGSWKAVFGHLRAHRRQTPGAFPPPAFTPPEGSPERNNNDENALKDQLAPTLLNLARETMQKMSQNDSNTSVATGDASSSRRLRGTGLDIDLNEPRTSFHLDLNGPPPPEDDDDDHDNKS
ncbi:hypothetical protein V6N13_052471 [Hibiscus sabdariffa]|uniref:C2H2-type domain-containing protein n=1 Tax=Hibiscus sabdariffa TaxID=183260 RepID=A0ABR2Q4F7_9ROSI